MNLNGNEIHKVSKKELTTLDKWIYHSLNQTVLKTSQALESYRYNDAGQAVYSFFWNDFCDWYVEATKLSFRNGDEHEKDRAASVLLNVLEESLRLLHPYIPFVTEEIYAKLPLKDIMENRSKACDGRVNAQVTQRFDMLKDLIRSIRALRAECGIDPASKIHIAVLITPGTHAEVIREKTDMIQLLAGVSAIDFVADKPARSIGTVGDGFEAFLLVDESINTEQLIARFNKEIASEESSVKRSESKLNGSFAQHAPAEVVQAERDALAESKRRIEKLRSYVNSL